MSKGSEIRNRGARFLMVSASLVIVVAGLREIKPIALPLVVAIFLSVLSTPLLTWLKGHRVPGLIAVPATVLSNIAVMIAVLLLVGSSVRAFSESVPIYQERLEAKAISAFDWLENIGINTDELEWLRPADRSASIDDAQQNVADQDQETNETAVTDEGGLLSTRTDSDSTGPINFSAFVDVLGTTLRSIASLMTRTFLIFLMMVFILFEAASLPQKLKLALGWQDNDMARMYQARREIQRYLVIKTLVSIATGGLLYFWVWSLGVDFPLLWGLVAFFFNYIPTLGSIIASIPAMALAFIEMGFGQALIVGLGYMVVNIVLGNFIEPHLMGRQLGISTLVVFLSLLFWGWVWGPLGMLLAVPLTMILKIMLEHTEDFRWVALLISAKPQNVHSDPP